MTRLVFDIGGTSMRMGQGVGDRVEEVRKTDTPSRPEEALDALASYAKGMPGLADVSGGIAGIIEAGVVRVSPNLPAWDGFPFAERLAAMLGVPVALHNDAELAGKGEALYGAGKGYALVGYIGIGTGVGGSLIVNGESAPHAHGFEPGHHILDVESGMTFEQLVSGHALEERFGMPAKDVPQEAYDALVPTLAAGLYTVILDWSPEILVLGGSLMSEATGYRLSDVERALRDIPTYVPALPLIKHAALGDLNGLYGALA